MRVHTISKWTASIMSSRRRCIDSSSREVARLHRNEGIARYAPRSMKMGTTASLWRYDAAAARAIWPNRPRQTAILRYTSWAAVFPISREVRLAFDSGPFDRSRRRRDRPERDICVACRIYPSLRSSEYVSCRQQTRAQKWSVHDL